jgi:hypothetical protein
MFTVGVTYTAGAGAATAQQVLQDTLPAGLVPEETVILNNPAASEWASTGAETEKQLIQCCQLNIVQVHLPDFGECCCGGLVTRTALRVWPMSSGATCLGYDSRTSAAPTNWQYTVYQWQVNIC